MLALSVSISTSSSPRLTSSPSDFSHLRIVPSSIESDRRGIETSAMRRSVTQRHGRTDAAGLARRRVHERGRGHRRDREGEHRAAALAGVDPDLAALRSTTRRSQADPVDRPRSCMRRNILKTRRGGAGRSDSASVAPHRRMLALPAAPAERNFSAFATRFCSTWESASRSPTTTGVVPTLTCARASATAAASDESTSAITCPRSIEARVGAAAGARVSEQVLDRARACGWRPRRRSR